MARTLSVYSLLLLSLIIQLCTVTAAPLDTTSTGVGISYYIPRCAAECFQSFIKVSFSDRTVISLESLCSRIGVSRFTIGEAAVQCLVAERAGGLCSSEEANGVSFLLHSFMHLGG